jgi:hypothetical protein
LKGLSEFGPLTTGGATADEVDRHLAVSEQALALLAQDGLAAWGGGAS